MNVLQVIGYSALTLVVLIVLLLTALRLLVPWWIKRKLSGLAEAAKFEAPIAARIQLHRSSAQWHQAGTDALVKAFKQLGYQSAGRYTVPEMPMMQLWAGAHPSADAFAVVYDHPQLPPWFDLIRRNRQGVHTGVSNNPMHDPAFIPGDWNVLVDPAITPAEAQSALLKLALPGEPLPALPHTFAKAYEMMYAASMDHALAGPLPTVRSIQQSAERMARATGQPVPQLTPEQMDIALARQLAYWHGALNDAVLDHFLHSGQISAADFERVRDDLCIVHDRLDEQDTVDMALRASLIDEPTHAMAQAMQSCTSPSARFDAIQALLPATERLHLLGSVSRPLPARIYDGSTRAVH